MAELSCRKISTDDMLDLEFLFQARGHKDVDQFLLGSPPPDFNTHVEWIKKNVPLKREIYLVLADEQRIGYFQVVKTIPENPELGWVIHPDFQGLGYGKIAVSLAIQTVEQEGYKKCHLLVLKSNPKAFKIYSSSGFKSVLEEGDIITMSMDLKS